VGKVLVSALKPYLRIYRSSVNYQFINKYPASPPFLNVMSVLQLRTGLHIVLRICNTVSLSFSRWSILNLQCLMIYFRNFLYDIRYFPHLYMKLIAWQKNTFCPWQRRVPATHPVNSRLFHSGRFMSITN
jgi:hypothetical protein